MTKEERELSITYLEGIKEKYIEGEGYERHPLPEYYAIENAIKALEQQSEDAISREAVEDKLLRLCDELEGIFSDIREKNVDDSVCGLCEYDCDHGLDGYANECPGFERDDCFKLKEEYRNEWINKIIGEVTEW